MARLRWTLNPRWSPVAEYNPKSRRPRTQVPADEPAPVDAILEAVEHIHDELTLHDDAGEVVEAVVDPVVDVADVVADEVTAVSASPAPANPWVSSVPESPAGKGRIVIAVVAALAAVAVVVALLRRRHS
jgi:hypothetical protein